MNDIKTIKGYQIRREIGRGGFGAVYSAYQPIIEREVAIKAILPQYANQLDFIRRFEREAQLVASLEHPFIIPLYDYWRDPNGAFLVMRLMKGGNLRKALTGAWPPDRTAHLLEQIAEALQVAHRANIIH